MSDMEIRQTQWLSKPDGNIVGTLTDPRIIATAVGAAAGAVLEKQIWIAARETFGVASLENGRMKYYAPSVSGKGKVGHENPALGNNRQLARAGIILGCVAAIEYTPSGTAQYALLGMAAVAAAHILQDIFPSALR